MKEVRKLRDKALKFYEKSHKYKFKKETFTSVTQLTHKFFEPFDAKGIARKLAKFPVYKKRGMGVRAILAEWKESAEHGTRVHQCMEDWIEGKPNPKEFVEERDKLKFESGMKYMLENQTTEEDVTEVKIYSKKYKIAGMIDLLRHNSDGTISLVDWKTNKRIMQKSYQGKTGIHKLTQDMDDCHTVKYALQLSLYAYILESEYGFKIKDLEIVHLMETKYRVYKVPYTKMLAKAILKTNLEE